MVSGTGCGSFPSELLVSFLEYMDNIDHPPKIYGLKPFLLLDRHGPCLKLSIHKYVDNPNHQ